MKNVTIYVDVDLTLVDADGCLLDGARAGLEQLRNAGCHLYLWSTGGKEYCQSVAERYDLASMFDGFMAKPDIIIDDMPATASPAFSFDVNAEESWQHMARKIIDKHVD